VAVTALTAVTPGGPVTVKATAGGADSNAAGFGVTLDDELRLSASRDTLGFLKPRDTDLTLTYGGVPLPEGLAVSFSFDPAGLGGLASQAHVGPGGTVSAALEALDPYGPVALSASLGEMDSNALSFGVEAEGELKLSSSRDALELYEPRDTVLTLELDGVPLPEGTPVGFGFGADEISGLPADTEAGTGGGVAASLAALRATGPLGVSASVAGLQSNEVAFDVELMAGHLTMDWIFDPKTPAGAGFVGEDYSLYSCLPYQGSFWLRYRGKPLASESVILGGIAGGVKGLALTTDASGRADTAIMSTGTTLEGYQADPLWTAALGDYELDLQGPVPGAFGVCLP
jgi:hypothetical protein